jgi:phage baseplate assembly protein gpV
MHTTKEQYKLPGIAIEKTFIRFSQGSSLEIDKANGEIRLVNKQQEVQMTIGIKEEGLTVSINAAHLNINASESLNFSSKKINIDAEQQLNISTQGNLVTEIAKDALTEIAGKNKVKAAAQTLIADLGNIELKANDDIKLDGERVQLNCE